MTRTYHPGAEGDPPPYPDESEARRVRDSATAVHDPSAGRLVSQVANDLSTLFRQEIALAKAELRQEAVKAANGAKMYAIAAGAAYFAVFFLLLAAMFGLDEVMATGWAALIVSTMLAIATSVLASRGRKNTRVVHPVPSRTIKTIKENVRWARSRRR